MRKTNLFIPSHRGIDFSDDDNILNYKPTIKYVEPETGDLEEIPREPEPQTIDALKTKITDLKQSFDAIAELAEQVQNRLDARAKPSPIVKLDPIVDAHVIAAIQRRYPDKANPEEITYEDYKTCLNNMGNFLSDNPAITADMIASASNDPNRTDFGGLGNTQGENRPELANSSVKPLNLKAFQSASVVALFALLLPLLEVHAAGTIAKHLTTSRHPG